MHPIIQNILAVIAGVILGMMVNMGLIILGPMLIPPPEGVNMTDMESINASIHLLEPKNYIFPFLAHALGTLTGAFLAARLAARRVFPAGGHCGCDAVVQIAFVV